MEGFASWVAALMFWTAVLTAVAGWDEVGNLQHQAIERGYALYCPTTGDFAWKGECDD